MVKEMTGATVMIMDRDVPATQAIRPEGKPHPIDRILHHLDRVTLGGVALTAHLTPGHTEGNTTWTLKATEGDKSYDVVIPGSISPNGMTPVVNNKAYPYIAEDSQPALWVLINIYRKLLEKIAARQYDVFTAKVTLTVSEKLRVLGRGFLQRIT